MNIIQKALGIGALTIAVGSISYVQGRFDGRREGDREAYLSERFEEEFGLNKNCLSYPQSDVVTSKFAEMRESYLEGRTPKKPYWNTLDELRRIAYRGQKARKDAETLF